MLIKLFRDTFFLLFFILQANYSLAYSPPPVYAIDVTLDRAMYKNGIAHVSGHIDSPESAVTELLINDVPVDVVDDRFELALPSNDADIRIYTQNESGGEKNINLTLGSAIEIHIDRSVLDAGIARIRGFVDSSESAIIKVMVNQQAAMIEGDFFELDSPLNTESQRVEVVAENASGGKDTLWINFSQAAPERAISLKIRESGLDHIEPMLSDLIDAQRETLADAISQALAGINLDLGIVRMALIPKNVTVSDGSTVSLKPRATTNDMIVNAELLIHKIEAPADINLKACIWLLDWHCTAGANIPVYIGANDVGMDVALKVGPGIKTPIEEATLVSVESTIDASIGHSDIRLAGIPFGNILFDAIINNALLPGLADSSISNMINTEVANIINVVPTRIPALIVDNDNGVSEILEGYGALSAFKMVVRGIGANLNIGETLSTDSEAIVPLDINLFTGTADDRVRFGYVSRDLPLSNEHLLAVTPTVDKPFDGIMVLGAELLNSTLNTLTQTSLMDFTLPLNFASIAGDIPAYLQGKDLALRIAASDGAPYFSLPESAERLVEMRMNDYVLDFLVNGESLLHINLDMNIASDLGLENNRLVFSSMIVDERVRSLALQGQSVALEEAQNLEMLIDLMTNVAARAIFNAMGELPVPMLPGGTTLSFDAWRINESRMDIALAFNFVESAVLANHQTASNTSEMENLASHLMADSDDSGAGDDSSNDGGIASGVEIPAELLVLLEALDAIASIMTHVGNEPLNPLPVANVDRGYPNENLPLVPAINRQTIALKDGDFTRPRITSARLTRDGRVGVDAFAPLFTLLKPEMISEAFTAADAPLLLTDSEVSLDLSSMDIHRGTAAICDPEPKYFPNGKKENPYRCGIDGKDDCYDLSLVISQVLNKDTTFSDLLPLLDRDQVQVDRTRLNSIPIRIQIEQPKTAAARISAIDVVGETKQSAEFSGHLFEMSIPNDGRLFITRISGRALTWYNEGTDDYVNGVYDAVYAVIPEDADACDVSAFAGFKPLSHAPYDDAMKRYKFAAYPFRDPMGKPIADGAEMKGTYPWVSMDGSMMSMTTIGVSRLFPRHHIDGDTRTRYPSRCLEGIEGCTEDTRADVQFRSLDAGLAFFGLWTHGKMVLADGMINESDFKMGTGAGEKEHSLVSLYAPGTGREGNESGEIEVGETRAMTVGPNIIGKGALLGNGTIFDTITNRLNFWPALSPVSTRDVVWSISSGRQTDELSFDDYLNPDALIISDMVGALDSHNTNDIAMEYYDGWNQAELDFSDAVRVQNSATALADNWNIPLFGEVHFGRLEPTATGGIRGKGLWLDGQQTYVSYAIDSQPQLVRAKPWFINLFIDPRSENDATERSLIYFPDGSSLSLIGRGDFVYRNKDQDVVHIITLEQPLADIQWTQLALQVGKGGKNVQFYLNGFLYDTWASNAPIFQLDQGELLLGANRVNASIAPFKGWIDEFKVIAQYTNPEVVCNHAMGTMVGLPDGYAGGLKAQAESYPDLSHAAMTMAIRGYGHTTYPRYACFHDYSDDYAAHLQNIPDDAISVRDSLLFPEGPIYHDKPRPDSVNNNFCLSCHHKEGKGGLSISALAYQPGLMAKYDHRRQPLQAPPKVSGNIPSNWLAKSPDYAFKTPAEGTAFDEFLLASAAEVNPVVKGFTLVNADTGMDVMPIEQGAVLNLAHLPANIAIRIVTNGITQAVLYTLSGDSWSETSSTLASPFAIFGVEQEIGAERHFTAGELTVGNYTLSAEAKNGIANKRSITFSVMGISPEAEVYEQVQREVPEEEEIDILQIIIDFFTALYDSLFGETEAPR